MTCYRLQYRLFCVALSALVLTAVTARADEVPTASAPLPPPLPSPPPATAASSSPAGTKPTIRFVPPAAPSGEQAETAAAPADQPSPATERRRPLPAHRTERAKIRFGHKRPTAASNHPAPIDEVIAAAMQGAKTPTTEPRSGVPRQMPPARRTPVEAAPQIPPPAARKDHDAASAAESPESRPRPVAEEARPYPPEPPYQGEATVEPRRLRPGLPPPPYPPPFRFPWPW
jgi:flagellar hook-length control protein FliK